MSSIDGSDRARQAERMRAAFLEIGRVACAIAEAERAAFLRFMKATQRTRGDA